MYDCIVIGGGQSGLATGYYLRKQGVNFLIFDAEENPGGAWHHMWPSLTLFSHSAGSNLPGWPMPYHPGFPPAEHVVDYLTRYEERYDLPIRRPVHVDAVDHDGSAFHIYAGENHFTARAVVAATGTWQAPFIPYYPGNFAGQQLHTVHYDGPSAFQRSSVAVVGGGNSGAQIAADLLLNGVDDVTWYLRGKPQWMPDDVDGRILFRRNRERLNAMQRGEPDPGVDKNIGSIVMVPPVLKARDAGLLTGTEMFDSLDEVSADYLIWATGFRPALRPIAGLLDGRDPKVNGLYLVGYGNWTGPGSATITGVSPFAREVGRLVAGDIAKQ